MSRLKTVFALVFAAATLAAAAGAVVSKASSSASSYSGTWQTTWKNADGSTGKAPMTVKVDLGNANAFDGVVEMKGPNSVMYGSLSPDGKTWSGDWWSSREKGTFTFTLKGNKAFDGSYTIVGNGGNFVWNGTR